MKKKTKLFVALDGFSMPMPGEPGDKLSKTLYDLDATGLYFGIKVNLDYVLRYGYDGLTWFERFNRPLFVDLKMFNGKKTMRKIAEEMVRHEVDFFNVMALADSQIAEAVKVTRGTKTKVFAVTVLTHFGEEYCQKHFCRSLPNTVRHLGETAIEAGCDGLIFPGSCLDAVDDLQTLKVVPGVRPSWYADSRHTKENEIAPRLAMEKGADICVCGSPIVKGNDPVEALQKILSEFER